MTENECQIAGITFRLKDDPELATYRPEGLCNVEPEPDNKFDPLALKVLNNGRFIGYIPSDKAQIKKAEDEGIEPVLVQSYIHQAIRKGKMFSVVVDSYCYRENKAWNNDHKGKLGAITLIVRCDVDPVKADTKTPVVVAGQPEGECLKLKSFNEEGVVVDFYPGPHTYWYEGKQLSSVTRAVGLMYAPFQPEVIAPRCEKKYGMKAADIVDLWARNGEAASGFGTALHACLENYQLYGEQALPKMPVLRDIVTSFPWVSSPVHTEVLITSVKRGICGLCDRLMINGGVHTVCDFKFSVGIADIDRNQANKLYPNMPKNKVTKAVVQESLYADMLEESGLTVSDDVVVHTWAGEWVHYREKRVKGILGKVCG